MIYYLVLFSSQIFQKDDIPVLHPEICMPHCQNSDGVIGDLKLNII